jgi:hypothetical protein
MPSKKIIIVGGGISGCVSAYYLSCKGHKVEIYEKSGNIGGIMRDHDFDGEIFFSGPHYLNPDIFWTKDVIKQKNNKNLLKKINFSYGSYTNLFKEIFFSKNFAHPVTRKKFLGLKKNEKIKEILLLQDRFNHYQKTISTALIKWCKNFTDQFDILHSNCRDILAVGKILFINDQKKISSLKKKNKLEDDLLGIPNLNYRKIKAYVPPKGYNFFFEKLLIFLKKKKVSIKLNSHVQIKKDNKKILFINKGKELKADYFIWASNPVPLFKTLKDNNIDNPFTRAFLAFFKVKDNPNKVKDIYIQVFSNKTLMTRVYIYNIHGITKVTVEGIYSKKKSQLSNIVKYTNEILKQIDPKIKLSKEIKIKKIVKHNLLTVSDYNSFLNFKDDSKKNGIISGAWHINTREKKIDKIIDNLKKLNL